MRQQIADTTSNNKLLATNSAPTNSNNKKIAAASNHFVDQRCHCSPLLLFEVECQADGIRVKPHPWLAVQVYGPSTPCFNSRKASVNKPYHIFANWNQVREKRVNKLGFSGCMD